MTKTVYSVNGAEVDLKEAAVAALAEIVDGLNDEISQLSEQRQLLMRELARRMENKPTLAAGEWNLSFKPYVNVSRRSTA